MKIKANMNDNSVGEIEREQNVCKLNFFPVDEEFAYFRH